MAFSKAFYYFVFVGLVVSFSACNDGINSLTSNGAVSHIDLFKEDAIKILPSQRSLFLPADTAYKYSDFVCLASSISLVDSSYNRTTGDNFYLYSTVIDSTLKGSFIKKRSKLYFSSYIKLTPAGLKQYRLYLVPFRNHKVIKNNLHIALQWLPNAEFIENVL